MIDAKLLLLIIIVTVCALWIYTSVKHEGFTDNNQEECPLEYVNLMPSSNGKYHLTLKVKGSKVEEAPKEFSTKGDAIKFWRFLKSNNNNLKHCKYPFEYDHQEDHKIRKDHKTQQKKERDLHVKQEDTRIHSTDRKDARELRKMIHDVAQEAKDTYVKLSELNHKLDRNGDLTENEHVKVCDLADKTVDHAKCVRDAALKSKRVHNVLGKKVGNIEADENSLQYLSLKHGLSEKDQRDAVELSLKINEARFRLENHAERLAKLEEKINSTDSCVSTNKTVLSDIKSKLNNSEAQAQPTPQVPHATVAPQQGLSVTEKKRLQVHNTVKTIDNSLQKCPPCPMYASTYPVDVMEVTKQKVGTIAPLSQSLGLKID